VCIEKLAQIVTSMWLQLALSESRINMRLTLTELEIARSHGGPTIGTKGPIIQYRVGGLPPGERAFIANFKNAHEDSWRVFHTKRGIDAHWKGDYKTVDDALAALQNEY
jgi:hypothetical protein